MLVSRARLNEMIKYKGTIDPPSRELVHDMAKQMEGLYSQIEKLSLVTKPDEYYDCSQCGSPTYKIDGFCMDQEGIRSARFCPDCKTVHSVSASGMSVAFVLKDQYRGSAKSRITSLLRSALMEIEGDKS